VRPCSRPGLRSRLAGGLGWLLGGGVLFVCYVRISRTRPANSDGAANVLQAWDMLHGNVLLHGWWLSDVSFYTTELPEYVLIDWIRGASPDVMHVAAGLTYAVLVVLAGLLAKGRATGKAAIARILIATGIMLAPQPGDAVSTLLLAPDHVGSAVPVLLVFLLLDRAQARWYVPVLAAPLLTVGMVADPLVLVIGVLPVVAVCTWRACYQMTRRGESRPPWLDLGLIGAALAAAGASRLILTGISFRGGFVTAPVTTAPVTTALLRQNLTAIPRGVLLLYGASFSGQAGAAIALAALHLAGLALVAWAVASAVRWFRPGADRVNQLLVVAVLANLVATALLVQAAAHGTQREYAAVLPFGAVLAARILGPRIAASTRLAAALAVVLAGYALALVSALTVPTVPAYDARLSPWLSAHHLTYGIASYWNASIVTLTSGQRIHIVSWKAKGGQFRVHRWEAERSWYGPRRHNANFAVFLARQRGVRHLAVAVFGQPSGTYRIGHDFVVLVWHKNLLQELR
jgi:hypothetical protein